MALVVLVAACASPRSYSTAEKEAWIMDQQDRFNALSIAYVRGPDWRDLYEVTAAKVWSYGHQVHKGQLIGYSGMSGTLTGLVPHLHLALWLGGGSVNPQPELGRSLAWPL